MWDARLVHALPVPVGADVGPLPDEDRVGLRVGDDCPGARRDDVRVRVDIILFCAFPALSYVAEYAMLTTFTTRVISEKSVVFMTQ